MNKQERALTAIVLGGMVLPGLIFWMFGTALWAGWFYVVIASIGSGVIYTELTKDAANERMADGE